MSKLTIELTAESEDISPAQYERTQQATEGFAKAVAEVQEKAEGEWGWCTVKVTVIQKKGRGVVIGTAYLGCCSYFGPEDFIQNSGYFDDMVREAMADSAEITAQVEATRAETKRWGW